MTPDQIVAFVLALTSPAPLDPLFPVIAAGGADPRFPMVAEAGPRDSALAGLTSLDADAMAFAETALLLAMTGQRTDEMAAAMLARLEADRAAAFLENPEAPFDDSCAAAPTPAFLLPDGTWSK